MIDGNVVDMTFLGSPFRNQHTIIRGGRALTRADLPAFAVELRALAVSLHERMDAEDAELYAHLPDARPDRRVPA